MRGVRRLCVAAHHHPAAVLVDWRGGDDGVGAFAERLLEEEEPDGGAGGAAAFPCAASFDERGGLLPEDGLLQGVQPESVRDHAVLGRGEAGA